MPLRTYAYPKPSALGSRSGMSASTAAKSSAFTKPMIIRCANLSDRASARVRNETDGPPWRQISGKRPHSPDFKVTLKAQWLRMTSARSVGANGDAYARRAH
jgi:hypothetical protein